MDPQTRTDYYNAYNQSSVTINVYSKLYQILTIPDTLVESTQFCINKANLNVYDEVMDETALKKYKMCLSKFHYLLREIYPKK
jgi:hypothetical protein